MQLLAKQIHAIIGDYEVQKDQLLSVQDIIDWVNQFDQSDREFILSELLHLLSHGIYISKERAKELLWQNLQATAKFLKYKALGDFLRETIFLNTQNEGKSQSVLLKMLNEIVQGKTGIELNINSQFSAKNYLYVDDIQATGKTIWEDIRA